MNSICRLGTQAQLNATILAQVQAGILSMTPNTVQDSGNVAVAFGAPYVELLAASLGNSLWIQLISNGTAAGVNQIDLGTGLAGAEVAAISFNTHAAGDAFPFVIFSGPLYFPAGTRFAARASAINAELELHILYHV